TLIIGTMTAFTFSHIKFAGYKYIYNYFLIGMMFPAAAAILPLFLKIRDLGLLDSLSGVVIPQVAFGLGFSILLFRSFFEQLPSELFDAARVDGCSYIKFYWHVILPLSTPILATVGVFVLVASWNNYLLPLLVLNTEQQYPWTLGIMQYRGEYGIEWNRILAYVTVTITPAIVFFLFAQKYIVEGLTGGAVKG
ncbi:MAG: carbohydrate ABC transporter permease, partial [Gammaproteobacteria bacterium]|nr:carbohydrate ABC transporter permease [Gammaproteobacteria bacterium]